MPRKLKAIKNTFYAKFKTPSLTTCMHSYNCIDSYEVSSHLVQQKQEKCQTFVFIFIAELYRDVYRLAFRCSATEGTLFCYLCDTALRMC